MSSIISLMELLPTSYTAAAYKLKKEDFFDAYKERADKNAPLLHLYNPKKILMTFEDVRKLAHGRDGLRFVRGLESASVTMRIVFVVSALYLIYRASDVVKKGFINADYSIICLLAGSVITEAFRSIMQDVSKKIETEAAEVAKEVCKSTQRLYLNAARILDLQFTSGTWASPRNNDDIITKDSSPYEREDALELLGFDQRRRFLLDFLPSEEQVAEILDPLRVTIESIKHPEDRAIQRSKTTVLTLTPAGDYVVKGVQRVLAGAEQFAGLMGIMKELRDPLMQVARVTLTRSE